MTTLDIIKKFRILTDDQTELSSDEEVFFADKVLRTVYKKNQWEFLRKTASGSFTGGYIDISVVAPDFDTLMANYSESNEVATFPDTVVIWVGGNPYKVVPMGGRQNQSGVAYVDLVAKRIYILGIDSGTFEFDYKHRPATLTSGATPVIPEDFEMMIAYGMAMDDDVIQKTEKGRSNFKENTLKFDEYMSDLKSYNAKFFLM